MEGAPAWELSKENVVPVKQGRSVRDLTAVLSADKGSLRDERTRIKRQFEEALAEPSRLENPLAVWRDYIEWVKAAYPSGGPEAGLVQLHERAVRSLMDDARYKNDQDYIVMWVSYADAIPDPAEVFKFMYGRGIGLDVSLLYIAWAWAAEHAGNYAFAEKVYARGIARRALPLERLQSRQKEFHRRAAKKWASLGGAGGWDARAPVDLEALTAYMQRVVSANAAQAGHGGPANENAGPARHALTSITAAAAARSHRPAADTDLHAAVTESVAAAGPTVGVAAAARPYGYFGAPAPAPAPAASYRPGAQPQSLGAAPAAAPRNNNTRAAISVFTDAEFNPATGPVAGPARYDELGPRSAAAAAALAPLPGAGAGAGRPATTGSVTGSSASGPALVPAAGAAGWRDYGTEAGRRKENSQVPSAWTAPDAPLPQYAGTWEAPAAHRTATARAPAGAASDARITVFVDDSLAPPPARARPTLQEAPYAAPVAATPAARGSASAAAPAAIAAFFASLAAPAAPAPAAAVVPEPLAVEEEDTDASKPSFEELRAAAWKVANPHAFKQAAAARAAAIQRAPSAAATFAAAAAAPGRSGDVTVSASDIYRLLSDSTVGSADDDDDEDTAMARPAGYAVSHQSSFAASSAVGAFGGLRGAAAPPAAAHAAGGFAVYEDTALGPAGAAVVFDEEEEPQQARHAGGWPAAPRAQAAPAPAAPAVYADSENAGALRTVAKPSRGPAEGAGGAATGHRVAFQAMPLPEAVPATPAAAGPSRILFRTAPRPVPGTLAYTAVREEALAEQESEDGDEEGGAAFSGGDEDVTLHTRLAMEDVNDLFASPSQSPAAAPARSQHTARGAQPAPATTWGSAAHVPAGPFAGATQLVSAAAPPSRPVPPDARRMSVNMAAAARRRSVMPAGAVAPSLRPLAASAAAVQATSPPAAHASSSTDWSENAVPGAGVPGLLAAPAAPSPHTWERAYTAGTGGTRHPLQGLSYSGPAHAAQQSVHAGFPPAPPSEGAFIPATNAVLVGAGRVHPDHARGWAAPPAAASTFSVFMDPENRL